MKYIRKCYFLYISDGMHLYIHACMYNTYNVYIYKIKAEYE